MEGKFTGNKDTDRLILSQLDRKDLLSVCKVNKYLNSLCDENLFRNLINNSPLKEIKARYEKINITYKQFYIMMSYYIGILEEQFNIRYSFGNPRFQYLLLEEFQKYGHRKRFLNEIFRIGEFSLFLYSIKYGARISDTIVDYLLNKIEKEGLKKEFLFEFYKLMFDYINVNATSVYKINYDDFKEDVEQNLDERDLFNFFDITNTKRRCKFD